MPCSNSVLEEFSHPQSGETRYTIASGFLSENIYNANSPSTSCLPISRQNSKVDLETLDDVDRMVKSL
jgi:hypothetical protein